MSYKNLHKALLFLKKQLFCLKIENFGELQLSYNSICSAKISHAFSTYHCLTKFMWDLFYSIQIFSYFQKAKKNTWFLHNHFYTFINKSRFKQNKNNPTHLFVDITKYKTCAKFQQKKLKSMVVAARQSFQFFFQKKYLVSWKWKSSGLIQLWDFA